MLKFFVKEEVTGGSQPAAHHQVPVGGRPDLEVESRVGELLPYLVRGKGGQERLVEELLQQGRVAGGMEAGELPGPRPAWRPAEILDQDTSVAGGEPLHLSPEGDWVMEVVQEAVGEDG